VGATIAVAMAFVLALALSSTAIAGASHDHGSKDRSGNAQYSPGGDQYKPGHDQYGGGTDKRLYICHKGRRMMIPFHSWWTFKRHGWALGRCDSDALRQFKLRKLEKQIAALEALLARLKEKQAKLAQG
jgi:hypothetical protein